MEKKNWYNIFVTETEDNAGNPFRYILMGNEEYPIIYMDSVWEKKSNEKLWEEKDTKEKSRRVNLPAFLRSYLKLHLVMCLKHRG